MAIIWALPSYLVARMAERKGRNFALWLLASLLFTWVPFLIGVLLLPSATRTSEPTHR